MDCSPTGSSVHGISQERILEWIAISFSRGSSWPRGWMHVSCLGRQILYLWATSSVQLLSLIRLFVTPWTAACQASLLFTISQVCSNSCSLTHWCHPTISYTVIPFFSWPQSFQHQGLFKWVSSSHQVAKVLEFHLHHQSYKWTPRTYLL